MLKRVMTGLVVVALTATLRAQDAAPAEGQIEDNDHSPYHEALLEYKSGHFDKARAAIDEAEKAKAGDPAIEILKSKICAELGDFAVGEQALRPLLTSNGPVEVELALGDLLLRKRSFDRAGKYYSLALKAKPNDPDIILKLAYTKIGANDLVTAEQYASQLKPLDPKNPYDDHASYYFAKAALAQATGKVQEAEDEIQSARTNYGVTVTNRYLKTYLEFFAPSTKGGNNDITPAPLVKPAPPIAKP